MNNKSYIESWENWEVMNDIILYYIFPYKDIYIYV